MDFSSRHRIEYVFGVSGAFVESFRSGGAKLKHFGETERELKSNTIDRYSKHHLGNDLDNKYSLTRVKRETPFGRLHLI